MAGTALKNGWGNSAKANAKSSEQCVGQTNTIGVEYSRGRTQAHSEKQKTTSSRGLASEPIRSNQVGLFGVIGNRKNSHSLDEQKVMSWREDPQNSSAQEERERVEEAG